MPISTVGIGRFTRKHKLTFDEVINEVKYNKRVFVEAGGLGRRRVRKQSLVVALEESPKALFDCTVFNRGILVRGVVV